MTKVTSYTVQRSGDGRLPLSLSYMLTGHDLGVDAGPCWRLSTRQPPPIRFIIYPGRDQPDRPLCVYPARFHKQRGLDQTSDPRRRPGTLFHLEPRCCEASADTLLSLSLSRLHRRPQTLSELWLQTGPSSLNRVGSGHRCLRLLRVYG